MREQSDFGTFRRYQKMVFGDPDNLFPLTSASGDR
jgi:hypothetical protein